jgi:hypothetical protein
MLAITIILAMASVVEIFVGSGVAANAKSAVHEIEAGMSFGFGFMTMGVAGIVWSLRRR